MSNAYRVSRVGLTMPRGGNQFIADKAWRIGKMLCRPIHIYDVIDWMKREPTRGSSPNIKLKSRSPTPNQLAQVMRCSGYFDKVGHTRVDNKRVMIYQIKSVDELIETKVTSGIQTRTNPKNFPKFLKEAIEERGLNDE